MIRHDVQDDIKQAHIALLRARDWCNSNIVLDEIGKAHCKILDVAEKLGVDLIGG